MAKKRYRPEEIISKLREPVPVSPNPYRPMLAPEGLLH